MAVRTQAAVVAPAAAVVHPVAHPADQAAAALHRAVPARVPAAAVVVARAKIAAAVRIVAVVIRARPAAVIHVVPITITIGAASDARRTKRIEPAARGVPELKLMLRLSEIETAIDLTASVPLRWVRTAAAIGTAPEMKIESQIATEIGVSQMHVSRLLAKSLAALRSELTEEL